MGIMERFESSENHIDNVTLQKPDEIEGVDLEAFTGSREQLKDF